MSTIQIETVPGFEDLLLSKERYWNLDTFTINPLRRIFLNTVDLINSPGRIFQNAEARFQADCKQEIHRKTYGRPWSLGSHFFDVMKEQGLQKHHKVLDFGCGSGRLGIHLIDFLDEGRYYGVESHSNSLRAFAVHEIPKLSLEQKQPRLLLDRNFSFDHFKTEFDFVIETSVTQHIYDDSLVKDAYKKIANVLSSEGKYLVSPRLRIKQDEIEALGLQKLQELESNFSKFRNTKHTAETYWSLYTHI